MTYEEMLAIREKIESTDDIDILDELKRAASGRLEALWKLRTENAVRETWKRYARFKPGIDVWCCCTGTFLGGPLQRGDRATVRWVRPRARRLALTIRGQAWTFVGATAHSYNFRTIAPETNVDAIRSRKEERRDG